MTIPATTLPDDIVFYMDAMEERIAIMVIDGNVPEEEAEALASFYAQEELAQWRKRRASEFVRK